MDRTFHPTFSLKHFNGEKVVDVPITKLTGEVYELVDEISMVSRAIRGEGLLAATGEDGKWSVRMCLEAQASVDRGAVVNF